MFEFSVISMLILPQRTQNNAFNIFIWTSLFVGLGMQMCLYSIEWYARQNCPRAVVSHRKVFDLNQKIFF
jgi:sterol O-acyltransferase